MTGHTRHAAAPGRTGTDDSGGSDGNDVGVGGGVGGVVRTARAATVLRDRIYGGLLGMVTGAALGVTVDDTDLSPTELAAYRARRGTHRGLLGGGKYHLHAGETGYAVDLALALTTGYRHTRPGIDAFARSAVNWYSRYLRDDRHTIDELDEVTRPALTLLAAGHQPTTTGCYGTAWADDTARTNAAALPRAFLPGVLHPHHGRRYRAAIELTAMTHLDHRCLYTSVAFAELVHTLLDGGTLADAAAVLRARRPADRDLHDLITAALDGDSTQPEAAPTNDVRDVLVTAITAVHHDTTRRAEPGQTLVDVANRGGAATLTTAITGALLGLHHGAVRLGSSCARVLDDPRDDTTHTGPHLYKSAQHYLLWRLSARLRARRLRALTRREHTSPPHRDGAAA